MWLALALWTGYTFVGYFTPISDLGLRAISLRLEPWETFWVLFYGFATYGNAGSIPLLYPQNVCVIRDIATL